jgi:hypothetical protein
MSTTARDLLLPISNYHPIEIWATHMCNISPIYDPISFFLAVWELGMLLSSVLLTSITQSVPVISEIIVVVCIIRSGRGSGTIINLHKDVFLPSNFRFERRIGYSFEIQNASWLYFGYILHFPKIHFFLIRHILDTLKEWGNCKLWYMSLRML